MAILFLDLKNISIAILHTFSRVPWSTYFGWQGLDPTFMLSSSTLSQLWPVFHVLQVDSQRIPLVFVLSQIKPVPLKSAFIPTCREWQVLTLSLCPEQWSYQAEEEAEFATRQSQLPEMRGLPLACLCLSPKVSVQNRQFYGPTTSGGMNLFLNLVQLITECIPHQVLQLGMGEVQGNTEGF